VSRELPGTSRTFHHSQGVEGVETRGWSSKDVSNLTVHICTGCNGLLASRQEDWAVQSLQPFLCRDDQPEPFPLDDHANIARWVYKTAAMIDLTAPEGGAIPTEHRQHFISTGDVPPRCFVWVGRNGQEPSGAETQHWQVSVDYPDSSLTGYLVTGWIGFLVFQVLGILSGPPRRVMRRSSQLFLVWPLVPGQPLWLPAGLPSLSAEDFAKAHHGFFDDAALPTRLP
jgi:hypothetical protein